MTLLKGVLVSFILFSAGCSLSSTIGNKAEEVADVAWRTREVVRIAQNGRIQMAKPSGLGVTLSDYAHVERSKGDICVARGWKQFMFRDGARGERREIVAAYSTKGGSCVLDEQPLYEISEALLPYSKNILSAGGKLFSCANSGDCSHMGFDYKHMGRLMPLSPYVEVFRESEGVAYTLRLCDKQCSLVSDFYFRTVGDSTPFSVEDGHSGE
jgi:hypothetical protein